MTTTPQLVRPPALQAGDRVHVISPAGPVIPENLADGIARLREWGLDVVIGDSVYQRRPPFDYLAGDDQTRLRDLETAWFDPACRAIICSRGGYGTMRLLPHLDLARMAATPRLFVGFSDITALHLSLAGVGGIATLHGPVVKSIGLHDDDPHRSATHLREALFATTDAPAAWEDLQPITSGRATGPVFGGNLSLLIPLLATPYCPSLDGAIVIIEDVGEVDYRLDRLLTALRLASGSGPAGLVLGDFTECHGVYVDEERIQTFIAGLASEFDCPVVMGAPLGHGTRNVPFPVGVEADLDADAGTLQFSSHAALSH